jgi:DnaJ-class molecular chaperone
MSPDDSFPNYYELLGIPMEATAAEIHNGHIYAASLDSRVQHQRLCDEALAVLESRETRAEYDWHLNEWTREQLELGTTTTGAAISTIDEVNHAIDAAERALADVSELIFEYRHADATALRRVRNRMHALCRSAAEDAGSIRKWSQKVLESCDEANHHVSKFQYLLNSDAQESYGLLESVGE